MKEQLKNKIYKFTLDEYLQLKDSGMFWELYPEATGNYESDKQLSLNNKFEIEKD